jgi:hypothetical protein
MPTVAPLAPPLPLPLVLPLPPYPLDPSGCLTAPGTFTTNSLPLTAPRHTETVRPSMERHAPAGAEQAPRLSRRLLPAVADTPYAPHLLEHALVGL